MLPKPGRRRGTPANRPAAAAEAGVARRQEFIAARPSRPSPHIATRRPAKSADTHRASPEGGGTRCGSLTPKASEMPPGSRGHSAGNGAAHMAQTASSRQSGWSRDMPPPRRFRRLRRRIRTACARRSRTTRQTLAWPGRRAGFSEDRRSTGFWRETGTRPKTQTGISGSRRTNRLRRPATAERRCCSCENRKVCAMLRKTPGDLDFGQWPQQRKIGEARGDMRSSRYSANPARTPGIC